MKSITLDEITYVQALGNNEIELGLRDDTCETYQGIINNVMVKPGSDTLIVTFDVPNE